MSSWHSTGRQQNRKPPRRQVSIRLSDDELEEVRLASRTAAELIAAHYGQHQAQLWRFANELSLFIRSATLEKAKAICAMKRELETSHQKESAEPARHTRSDGHRNVTRPSTSRRNVTRTSKPKSRGGR